MLSAPHVHRILLDSPNGPTVEGKCVCGYTRTYSSSGDDEAGLWPAAMKAKRLKGGDVVKAKKGGARSAAQAMNFYGSLA